MLGRQRRQVERLLLELAEEPRPANLDIRTLRGRAPWARARVGTYRVIFRRLTTEETRQLGAPGRRGYLVARIVQRRDLERAIASL